MGQLVLRVATVTMMCVFCGVYCWLGGVYLVIMCFNVLSSDLLSIQKVLDCAGETVVECMVLWVVFCGDILDFINTRNMYVLCSFV